MVDKHDISRIRVTNPDGEQKEEEEIYENLFDSSKSDDDVVPESDVKLPGLEGNFVTLSLAYPYVRL